MVFCQEVPYEVMVKHLALLSVFHETHYVVDHSMYKTLIFQGLDMLFLQELKPYYAQSQYLTREFTYKSFLTILRQICRANGFTYYTKNQYDRSVCYPVYFIEKRETKVGWTTI